MIKKAFFILVLIFQYQIQTTLQAYSCQEQCEFQVCYLPSQYEDINEQDCVDNLNISQDCFLQNCQEKSLNCALQNNCANNEAQKYFFYCLVSCQERNSCQIEIVPSEIFNNLKSKSKLKSIISHTFNRQDP
ncbi:hypothetical protein ABPG74_007520 [Tetrahymena malaccensis]